MFLIDKYAPIKIEDFLFHKEELEILKKMSEDESIPHIIFYGPEGSGKKTLIKLFLEMIYDKYVNKLTDTIYTVAGSGNTTVDVSIKQSNYHIVIEPNNTNFDRYIIQDVVKEYAKRVPLRVFTKKKVFKTVLINNLDNLSYYAQTSLRRTMEIFSETCRFIMWCRSLSKVIEPLRSRCYCFRIKAPSDEQLFDLLLRVAVNERISLDPLDYDKIILKSNNNIKKALWLLELKKFNDNFNTTFEYIINQIIKNIMSLDLKSIYVIRELLYKIMITNINGTQIIKEIVNKLLKLNNINNECKYEIVKNSAIYEHNLILGRREIIHLEAFITSIMYCLYKLNK